MVLRAWLCVVITERPQVRCVWFDWSLRHLRATTWRQRRQRLPPLDSFYNNPHMWQSSPARDPRYRDMCPRTAAPDKSSRTNGTILSPSPSSLWFQFRVFPQERCGQKLLRSLELVFIGIWKKIWAQPIGPYSLLYLVPWARLSMLVVSFWAHGTIRRP